MAIVAELGDVTKTIDKPLHSWNRSGAADPNGAITPQFAGELYLDTANKKLWYAVNLTNTSWISFYGPET